MMRCGLERVWGGEMGVGWCLCRCDADVESGICSCRLGELEEIVLVVVDG